MREESALWEGSSGESPRNRGSRPPSARRRKAATSARRRGSGREEVRRRGRSAGGLLGPGGAVGARDRSAQVQAGKSARERESSVNGGRREVVNRAPGVWAAKAFEARIKLGIDRSIMESLRPERPSHLVARLSGLLPRCFAFSGRYSTRFQKTLEQAGDFRFSGYDPIYKVAGTGCRYISFRLGFLGCKPLTPRGLLDTFPHPTTRD